MHLLTLGSLFLMATMPGIAAEPRLEGVWEARVDGLPALTVTLREVEGRLQGSVVFCFIRHRDGKPARIERRTPCTMLSVQRDGESIVFEVSHAESHPGESSPSDPNVRYRMDFKGETDATIRWLNYYPDNPPLRLVRQPIQ